MFFLKKNLTYDVLHVLVEGVSQAGRHQGVGGGDVHEGDRFLEKNILLYFFKKYVLWDLESIYLLGQLALIRTRHFYCNVTYLGVFVSSAPILSRIDFFLLLCMCQFPANLLKFHITG